MAFDPEAFIQQQIAETENWLREQLANPMEFGERQITLKYRNDRGVSGISHDVHSWKPDTETLRGEQRTEQEIQSDVNKYVLALLETHRRHNLRGTLSISAIYDGDGVTRVLWNVVKQTQHNTR